MLVVEPKPDHKRAIGQPLLTLEQVEGNERRCSVSSSCFCSRPVRGSGAWTRCCRRTLTASGRCSYGARISPVCKKFRVRRKSVPGVHGRVAGRLTNPAPRNGTTLAAPPFAPMRPPGRTPRPGPIVLIVAPDPATQLLLEWAAELEGLKPIVVGSASDAYGILAEESNQIILVVLDIACGEDAVSARRLQLDAPRVAPIPAVVLTERPLTETERTVLRPAITVMKPLQVEEAQEIMRGSRSATWREGAFIRGLPGGGPGIVLH